MLLIELKPDHFAKDNVRYERKRYVTDDHRFYISYDLLFGILVFNANGSGRPSRIILHGDIETIDQAKEAIEKQYPLAGDRLIIHETQFKNNSKPI